MNSKLKKITSFSIGKFLNLLCGLITVKVISDVIDPKDLLEISKYQSVLALLVGLIFTPMNALVQRSLHQWIDNASIRINFKKIIYFILLSAILFSILITAINLKLNILKSNNFNDYQIFLLICICAFLNGVFLISTSTILNFKKNFHYLAIITATSWINLLLGYFLYSNNDNFLMWLIGTNLGFSLGLFTYLCIYKYKESGSIGSTYTYRDYMSFLLPQALIYGLVWLQTQSYRFLVLDEKNIIIMGNLIFVYAICGTAFNAFDSLFNELVMPRLLENTKNKNASNVMISWIENMRFYIPYQFICSILFLLLMPFLIDNFLGERYKSIKDLYAIVIVSELMRSVSIQSINQLGFLSGKPLRYIYFNFVVTTSTLILMWTTYDYSFTYFIPISFIGAYFILILIFILINKNIFIKYSKFK